MYPNFPNQDPQRARAYRSNFQPLLESHHDDEAANDSTPHEASSQLTLSQAPGPAAQPHAASSIQGHLVPLSSHTVRPLGAAEADPFARNLPYNYPRPQELPALLQQHSLESAMVLREIDEFRGHAEVAPIDSVLRRFHELVDRITGTQRTGRTLLTTELVTNMERLVTRRPEYAEPIREAVTARLKPWDGRPAEADCEAIRQQRR